MGVWPTRSLRDVAEILNRSDLAELSPLKFYVSRRFVNYDKDGKSTAGDALRTGRISVCPPAAAPSYVPSYAPAPVPGGPTPTAVYPTSAAPSSGPTDPNSFVPITTIPNANQFADPYKVQPNVLGQGSTTKPRPSVAESDANLTPAAPAYTQKPRTATTIKPQPTASTWGTNPANTPYNSPPLLALPGETTPPPLPTSPQEFSKMQTERVQQLIQIAQAAPPVTSAAALELLKTAASQFDSAMKAKGDALAKREAAKNHDAIEASNHELEAANRQLENANARFEDANRQLMELQQQNNSRYSARPRPTSAAPSSQPGATSDWTPADRSVLVTAPAPPISSAANAPTPPVDFDVVTTQSTAPDGRPVYEQHAVPRSAVSPHPTQNVAASSSASPSDKSALRYNGKTFDEWKNSWQTELSSEKRTEAVHALAAFGARFWTRSGRDHFKHRPGKRLCPRRRFGWKVRHRRPTRAHDGNSEEGLGPSSAKTF